MTLHRWWLVFITLWNADAAICALERGTWWALVNGGMVAAFGTILVNESEWERAR